MNQPDMKVEIRLLIGMVGAIVVLLWNFIKTGTLTAYEPVVAFAVLYFISPYICNRTFFFGRKDEQNQQKKGE